MLFLLLQSQVQGKSGFIIDGLKTKEWTFINTSQKDENTISLKSNNGIDVSLIQYPFNLEEKGNVTKI